MVTAGARTAPMDETIVWVNLRNGRNTSKPVYHRKRGCMAHARSTVVRTFLSDAKAEGMRPCAQCAGEASEVRELHRRGRTGDRCGRCEGRLLRTRDGLSCVACGWEPAA